jgi:hypothetical protein
MIKVGAMIVAAAVIASLAAAQEAPSSVTPALTGRIGTPGGTGPYPAIAAAEPTLPGHTLYFPADLPKAPLPIIAWGNGACRDNGLQHSGFLREIASHGYLVISVGAPRKELPIGYGTAPAKPPAGNTPPPRPGPDETHAPQLKQAIDWAQAENRRRGSPLAGHIATDRIAVMGHSCGGLQALAVGSDPRVGTVMIWNSGIYNSPAGGRSGVQMQKSELARLHTPIAYISGGPTDIAYANGLDDFARLPAMPAMFAETPIGHAGSFWTAANGGVYGKVAVAWLDWQLKGDRDAGLTFTGPACRLCTDPAWTIKRKGID